MKYLQWKRSPEPVFHSGLKIKSGWRFALLLFLASCIFHTAPSLYAQTTASLSGNVVDSTGAVISGATVTLSNVNRGITDAK
jgi:hypothetical protein